MLAELHRHPHARAVLGPALAPEARASHAYLFHGPGGSGKREAARAIAATWLQRGSRDPDSARERVYSGAHPDLTWVTPSGAHEILVADIEEPVIAAATRTPFEASLRVFVIERADELGDEAANRMLKTLEEPASFVHLILLTDRLGEVLPTIRSRCQLVRFDAPSPADVADRLAGEGVAALTAAACARLGLGDAEQARVLAEGPGRALRAAAQAFAQAALAGRSASDRPWGALLGAVRETGQELTERLESDKAADLEFYPKKERKRVETEWSERIRRARRRAETGALDLGLQLVTLWFADLAVLADGAEDLVRNLDHLPDLRPDVRPGAVALRQAMELVEETRQRFQLNVSEELACEALAYRLERVLAP
jgi:DNA polymerase III subunit delta'